MHPNGYLPSTVITVGAQQRCCMFLFATVLRSLLMVFDVFRHSIM